MQIKNILLDDSLPCDKKIQYIEKMIVKELNKSPNKVDIEKVAYYENLVVELGGEVCKKTDKELADNLFDIKNKAEKNNMNATYSMNVYHVHKKSFLRVAIALISVVIVLFSSFSIYAVSVGGYGKAWEYISSSIADFFKLGKKEETINGIKVIRNDYIKKYDNIETLIDKENLNLLYPTDLPNGIIIESIEQIFNDNGESYILFRFNDKKLSIEVINSFEYPDEFISQNTNYKHNNINVFIIQIDQENYQAVFHYNEFEYSIYSNSIEIIKNIILNMKGY